jgi:hypothetical protein
MSTKYSPSSLQASSRILGHSSQNLAKKSSAFAFHRDIISQYNPMASHEISAQNVYRTMADSPLHYHDTKTHPPTATLNYHFSSLIGQVRRILGPHAPHLLATLADSFLSLITQVGRILGLHAQHLPAIKSETNDVDPGEWEQMALLVRDLKQRGIQVQETNRRIAPPEAEMHDRGAPVPVLAQCLHLAILSGFRQGLTMICPNGTRRARQERTGFTLKR